jgi:hypothetical protein
VDEGTEVIDAIDSMSNGDNEAQDMLELTDWELGANKKKVSRKKIHLQVIRLSSRLKCHGGKIVEELATKIKKVLNVEASSKKSPIPFLCSILLVMII